MCNWAGRFNFIYYALAALLISGGVQAAGADSSAKFVNWPQFSRKMESKTRQDFKNGLSYIISGSLAVAGGVWGASITNDSIEKGVYMVFQSIGIASVGYGAYVWKIGGEDRSIYSTLAVANMTADEKTEFLKSYYKEKAERQDKERMIRAITHSLIAGLNIYNGSQQKQESIRNGLYFIGGINLLAAMSFTFEF